MTDDLVKRLIKESNLNFHHPQRVCKLFAEAADRIEADAKRIDELELRIYNLSDIKGAHIGDIRKRAIAVEREECAKIADDYLHGGSFEGEAIATAIRARK